MLWSCITRRTIKSLIWKNLNFPYSTSQVFNKNKVKWVTSEEWLWLWDWPPVIFLWTQNKIERKLWRIYFSPKDFWKGFPAVKRLAQEAGVSEDDAKLWLMRQAIWQIYLPASRHIARPTFESPNLVHRADLFFLPYDRLQRGKKVYKYELTAVDVASRFKAAEPLTWKDSSEVLKAFTQSISVAN